MIARLLDLPLDRRQTTVAQLVASLGPKLRLAPDLIGPITTVAQSRMAIYEHCGFDHGAIVLRELVTNREKRLLRPSGYSGKEGELWFVRLAPCPAPESASPSPDYCISLTPPHILTAQKQEWLAYFARNDIRSSEEGSEHRLGAFLKFGQGIQFWSDFLYENHCGRVEDVAFVSGVPDIRSVDQVTSEPRQEPAVRIENRSKTYLATEPAVPMVH